MSEAPQRRATQGLCQQGLAQLIDGVNHGVCVGLFELGALVCAKGDADACRARGAGALNVVEAIADHDALIGDRAELLHDHADELGLSS